jgi:hypothetical protein
MERVAERIPDLWRLKEDAARLYQLYLCRLQANRLHERVICACRQIRRYATQGPGINHGLFTYSFEIDALCQLQDYRAAWRQLRQRESKVFGKRLNLAHRQWSERDRWELAFSYAPLLFFLGRYRQGCALLEASLEFSFKSEKVRSYDMLFHVYNGDQQPPDRCRVTLAHFYDRLGKCLRDWQHWKAFVNGFHARLFRLSGVSREQLFADPGQLAAFVSKLVNVRDERTTSGVGGGQSDLIESAAKVHKRQLAMRRKLDEFAVRIKPVQDRTDRKLQELFPELQGLPT